MLDKPKHLSLNQAISEGRLEDFIRQAEASDIGPISQADFDAAATKVIKSGQSEDQTSRSASRDGSTGKRTR